MRRAPAFDQRLNGNGLGAWNVSRDEAVMFRRLRSFVLNPETGLIRRNINFEWKWRASTVAIDCAMRSVSHDNFELHHIDAITREFTHSRPISVGWWISFLRIFGDHPKPMWRAPFQNTSHRIAPHSSRKTSWLLLWILLITTIFGAERCSVDCISMHIEFFGVKVIMSCDTRMDHHLERWC